MHGEQILSMPVGMHVVEQQGIASARAEGNLALRDRQNHRMIIRHRIATMQTHQMSRESCAAHLGTFGESLVVHLPQLRVSPLRPVGKRSLQSVFKISVVKFKFKQTACLFHLFYARVYQAILAHLAPLLRIRQVDQDRCHPWSGRIPWEAVGMLVVVLVLPVPQHLHVLLVQHRQPGHQSHTILDPAHHRRLISVFIQRRNEHEVWPYHYKVPTGGELLCPFRHFKGLYPSRNARFITQSHMISKSPRSKGE